MIQVQFSSINRNATLVAVVTALWVYLISDNPIKIAFSLIVGLCCGVVYLSLSRAESVISFKSKIKRPAKLLFILFFLFLIRTLFIVFPINAVYVGNWLSLPVLNWLSFFLTLIFTLFIPGFVCLNLLHIYGKVPFLASLVLSAILSMYFTATFWFIVKNCNLTDSMTIILFTVIQFVLVISYSLDKRHNTVAERVNDKGKSININVVFALISIIIIFISFFALQEFIYQPFVRGDSWSYISTSIAINKGGFNLAPTGKFYTLSTPNFFETFVSSVTNLSGFPPVNSLMVLSLFLVFLLPVAFYVMCFKYTLNTKISLLSTFIFTIASGFGWLPFVSQKLWSSSVSYSVGTLSGILGSFAPKVLYDISQPQGVLSEGFKTYACGLLAIMILLYLFESELHSKVRLSLIAIITAFAFQFHIEEALIFTLAFIPVYLILGKKEKSFVRPNIVGVSCGLAIALLFDMFSQHTQLTISSFSYGIISIVSIGLFFSFTYIKTDTFLTFLKNKLKNYKLLIFLIFFYLSSFCFYVLIFYGYPNMTPAYSIAVVNSGFIFPWYYYPMSFGIVGVLILIGLLMNFENERKISLFLLLVAFLVILGMIISFFNVNLFFTGAKEWRIVYRVIPIPASVFAGWVLYKLMNFSKESVKGFKIQFRNKSHLFKVNMHHIYSISFILVILLGIPSTIIASEYWMSTGASPYGNVLPNASDIELANYFYQVPVTSRVAVSSYNSSALVRLAGCTTAISDIYPDFLHLTRPETISLFSSDIKYIVLDKSQSFNEAAFPMLNYLPVVFNNSGYTVYSMPTLQSPSDSNIGYLEPLQYNSESFPSFLIMASLNSSYQLVNDYFYNKSVLILPLDLPIIQQNALLIDSINDDGKLDNVSDTSYTAFYNVNAQQVKDWVKSGGKLVVFGGQGAIYKELGLHTDNINNGSFADSLNIDSQSYLFNETIKVNTLFYSTNNVKVLSYYQLNGKNVSPFAINKELGNGSIVYLNVDPLYSAANKSQISLLFNNNLISIIGKVFENIDMLPVSTINLKSVPLNERWMEQYAAYAKSSFIATGNIFITSILYGSYFLPKPVLAENLVINQSQVKTSLENSTIDSLMIEGYAKIEINSEGLTLAQDINSTPNYLPFLINNCSITIQPADGSMLKIQTDKRIFIVSNGSVTFKSKTAIITMERPSIDISGSVTFDSVSLPVSIGVWSDNINLQGKTKFQIGYADNQYVFFDYFTSPPSISSSNYPSQISIPLIDILLSPINIALLSCLIILFVILNRSSYLKLLKYKNKKNPR